ncbi:hypothetical protein [Agrobacterium rosae]|uniref:DUF2513 domain-containing protein n=1 Tax=Agrobacterium rosae TaxID=1972867 RepID=A0AAW9FIM5_9HYPH|nr:hypothetical protein [Agrobacterium rosae]MDX8302800.1 hypothetical protein [Agrobacterium rosae]
MDLLNRGIQRDLLKQLSEKYPHDADVQRGFAEYEKRQVQYNLFYLHEHGLVDIKAHKLLDGSFPIMSAKITAKGIDFITDDGGLGSILNVLTVRLHEDTLKSIIIGKVEASQADPSVKASVIAKIKGLPADALGKLAEQALDAGLGSIPDLTSWLKEIIPF